MVGASLPQWRFLLDRGVNFRTKRHVLVAGFPHVAQSKAELQDTVAGVLSLAARYPALCNPRFII